MRKLTKERLSLGFLCFIVFLIGADTQLTTTLKFLARACLISNNQSYVLSPLYK